MKIEKIISHENYKDEKSHLRNDIALLRLEKSLNSSYMPACLAPENAIYTGEKAWLYGWGAIVDTKAGCFVDDWSSSVLRKTTQRIISNKECAASKGFVAVTVGNENCDETNGTQIERVQKKYENRIFDDMICGENEGRGECEGDSGGPNTVEIDGKHILVGVTSWASGCAKVIT